MPGTNADCTKNVKRLRATVVVKKKKKDKKQNPAGKALAAAC